MARKFGKLIGYTGAFVTSLLITMGIAAISGLWFKLLFNSFRLGWKLFS